MILQNIFEQVRKQPDAAALFIAGKLYAYRDLWQKVTGIRSQIKPILPTVPFIGVYTDDNFDTYASILAVLAAGKGYVPINKKFPVDRNVEIIRDAGIDILLTTGLNDQIRSFRQQCPDLQVISTGQLTASEITGSLPDIREDDYAYLLFTSGSTGKPKGIAIKHRNLDGLVEAMLAQPEFQFSPDDNFLQMFELTFDVSACFMFLPWSIGATVYVPDREGVAYMNIYKLLEEQPVTVACMVPSVVRYWQPYLEEIRLPQLRLCMLTGEAMNHSLAKSWKPCIPNAKLFNLYGPTEATVFSLVYHWQEENEEAINDLVPIGRPLENMKAVLINNKNEAVAPGKEGELKLSGPQVVEGYWKDLSRSEAVFEQDRGMNTYLTGDICVVNENGNFVYKARKDNQVQIDGFRVELGEIEAVAKQFTGSEGIVATSIDINGSQTIHLVCEGQAPGFEELKDHLKQKLPDYMQPHELHRIDHIPFDWNGKIDHQAIKKIILNPS